MRKKDEGVSEGTSIKAGPSSNGRGVFASREFSKGEVIIKVRPARKISYRQLLRKKNTDNPVQISPRRYLDWKPPGLLFNHSCRPNAGLTSYPEMRFVALRSIRKGEELRWDYSTSMDKETFLEFKCGCGQRGCRGAIIGFYWLSTKLKRQYIELGVVQDFLKKEKIKR